VPEIESVLCIQRNRLPASWVEQRSVVPSSLDHFIECCSTGGYQFIDRPAAEENPDYKQIIPYIVLQTRDLSMTGIYMRQGSGKRLHDLWSLGIGGHINPVDQKKSTDGFEQILMAGIRRELDEELEHRPCDDTLEFAGVISEDITEVGKVHLGAVFRILTRTPEKFIPGHELFQFKWEKTASLETLNLELWSTLALELISNRSGI
jgi:predicted NUDIX family phosphoesterase